MKPGSLVTGDIVWINHIHTNQIASFKILDGKVGDAFSCEVRTFGKTRPMLVLWQEANNAYYYLLLMTSTKNETCCFNLFKRLNQEKESYIDCSCFFEYPFKMMAGPATKIPPLSEAEWEKLCQHLPPLMANEVTRLRAEAALHAHRPIP